MLNQKTIVFKQRMYGSGSAAVASPRKPPTLVGGYTEATLFI